MKQILVEWRKFLLKERDSDIMYQEMISFISDVILVDWDKYYSVITFDQPEFNTIFPNVLKQQAWAKSKNDRKDIEIPFSYSWSNTALVGLSPKKEQMNKFYNDFKNFQLKFRNENPLSSNGSKEILNSKEQFNKLFSMVRIVFFNSSERPDAAGDMATTGIMRIFLPFDRNTINLLNKPSPDYPSLFKDWITNQLNTEEMRRIISHEFAHFINAYRAKFKSIRTSGSGEHSQKQFDISADGGHWYANSTEEIQARFTEITSEIIKRFKQQDPKILNLLKNDFELFKAELLKLPRENGISTFGGELFYDKLAGKSQYTKKEPPPLPSLPPVPGLPPLPPVPPEIAKKYEKELSAKAKLTPRKKEEIKRKVDNRLLDLYNALKKQVD